MTVNKQPLTFYITVSSFRWFLDGHAWWWLEKGPKHAAYI